MATKKKTASKAKKGLQGLQKGKVLLLGGNKKSIVWTKHARAKMRFYGLSEQRVRRVLNSPKRIEEGIAPDTIAAMQSAGSEKHPHEIWVMFVKMENGRRIVSAWKYPGKTKPGDPLPREILNELSLSLMELD